MWQTFENQPKKDFCLFCSVDVVVEGACSGDVVVGGTSTPFIKQSLWFILILNHAPTIYVIDSCTKITLHRALLNFTDKFSSNRNNNSGKTFGHKRSSYTSKVSPF